MNIALVDDRETDRIDLEHMLKEYDSIHQLGMNFFHFPGGEELLREYRPFQYALVFLDIYMDGISGIETAEKIREADDDVVLVFLTSSEEHRSDAFSVFATSYLSKPCSAEQVFRTMDHILHLQTEDGARFFFSFDRQDYSLSFKEIVSLEKKGNYLYIVDKNGKNYRTRMSFTAVESQLDNRFLTLIKGILVNMDYVSQISDSRCLMHSGAEFPIHVKNKKDVQQKWLNYKFTKIRNTTGALGAVIT